MKHNYDVRLFAYQISAAVDGEQASKSIAELLSLPVWLVIQIDVKQSPTSSTTYNKAWPEEKNTEERLTFAEACQALNARLLGLQAKATQEE